MILVAYKIEDLIMFNYDILNLEYSEIVEGMIILTSL